MAIEVGREGRANITSPSLTTHYSDTDPPPTIRLTEGEETTVHCNVRGAFPAPIFTWVGEESAVSPYSEEKGKHYVLL